MFKYVIMGRDECGDDFRAYNRNLEFELDTDAFEEEIEELYLKTVKERFTNDELEVLDDDDPNHELSMVYNECYDSIVYPIKNAMAKAMAKPIICKLRERYPEAQEFWIEEVGNYHFHYCDF